MAVPESRGASEIKWRDGFAGDLGDYINRDDVMLKKNGLSPCEYAEPVFSFEDELILMESYCREAKGFCPDASELLSLLNEASVLYHSGDADGFSSAAGRFYDMYEDICAGRGGRLMVSGDYLLFVPEKKTGSYLI